MDGCDRSIGPRRMKGRLIKVGASWSGAIIEVPVDFPNFAGFAEHVADRLAQEAGNMVFITEDGHELTPDNFHALAGRTNLTFAYNVQLIESAASLGDLFELPDVPGPLEHGVQLPAGGSSPLSMDEQISCLEGRLKMLVDCLTKIDCRRKELEQASERIRGVQLVVEASLRAAKVNEDLHYFAISQDVAAGLDRVRKTLEKMTVLLKRCPLDLALMKRIPVHSRFSQREGATLFDLGGRPWQDQYLQCVTERDNISKTLEGLDAFLRQMKRSGRGVGTPCKTRVEGPPFQPRASGDNLEPVMSKISDILADKQAGGNMTENLLLVHKSGRLLSLAEVSSQYNEAYLNDQIAGTNAFREKIVASIDTLLKEAPVYQRRYAAVIENQAALAKAIADHQSLAVAMEEVQRLVATLESIHALPIAYVALISELIRQSHFIQHIKRSFQDVEKNLDRLLSEECVRRRNFTDEISKLFDMSLIDAAHMTSELSGNAVLFISDETRVEPHELKDLENQLRREQEVLPDADPMRRQLLTFIETVYQMRKRAVAARDEATSSEISRPLANLSLHERRRSREEGDSTTASKTGSSQELIRAYETRIRNLERLLQESYAAARGAGVHQQDRIGEETARLSQSIIRIQEQQSTENEWRDALATVYERAGLGPVPISADHAKSALLGQLNGAEAAERARQAHHRDHISYHQFSADDLVLLLPTVRKGVWSLFNVGAPNYYVHPDSLQDLMGGEDKQASWFLGCIKSIDARVSVGKVQPARHFAITAIGLQSLQAASGVHLLRGYSAAKDGLIERDPQAWDTIASKCRSDASVVKLLLLIEPFAPREVREWLKVLMLCAAR